MHGKNSKDVCAWAGFFKDVIVMGLYQSTMEILAADSCLSIQNENSYPESPLAKVMTSSVPSQQESF